MKKLLSLALALLMLASVATVALASTTTLTTTVPPATYTLNIPADQEIPFGATETDIGSITVTDAANFAEGKNLRVTLTYDAFSSSAVTTKIPFTVVLKDSTSSPSSPIIDDLEKAIPSGKFMTFKGKSDGKIEEYSTLRGKAGYYSYDLKFDDTMVSITSINWGKALAGDYTATITFTAEVVAE